jgi:hypothetical protein
VVIDDGVVQLRDVAVRGALEGDGRPEPGAEVTVRLLTADTTARKVVFAVA